jgi:hypothetical protein
MTGGSVPAARELPVILGDRILIPRGYLGRVGIAYRATPAFIELMAQLQFERVHAAGELLVHLLDQRGITRKTAGIEIAHLFDQRLQLLPRLGAILHRRSNLVEKAQSLLDLALGVCGIRTLLRSYGLTRDTSIARIVAAISSSIAAATARRIAYAARNAVADLARPVPTSLATLTGLPTGACLTTPASLASALPTRLTALLTTLLAPLARLPVLSLLRSRLARLPAELTRLQLPAETAGLALRPGTSAEAGNLIAQTGEIVHSAIEGGIF